MSQTAPVLPVDAAAAEALVRPKQELEARIRAFLAGQLGRVLPADPARGLGWYYDWVVLGGRSLEALRVISARRPPGGGPVLDVGSGLGTFVLLATRAGMPARGVEPGEAELALAHERAAAMGIDGERLFRPGTGEAMPYGDGSFSGVLLHDVLEHVLDWRAVLSECWRVLEPGGVLYVKGPSYTVRFIEPHYRIAWLPLLPKPLARRYLAARDRDVGYVEHLGYRRRGAVLAELRSLGFELTFPRLDKLRDPEAINRQWVRALVGRVRHPDGSLPGFAELAAENPLQSAIDVVARRP